MQIGDNLQETLKSCYSGNIKKNIVNLSSAVSAQRVVKVI